VPDGARWLWLPLTQNIEAEQLLNPTPPSRWSASAWRFAPGDKVMQVANGYEKEVFNGVWARGGKQIDAMQRTDGALSLRGIREQRRRRGDLWLG